MTYFYLVCLGVETRSWNLLIASGHFIKHDGFRTCIKFTQLGELSI